MLSDLEVVDGILLEQIRSLSEKISSGRIKDPVKEEIRIKQLKTLGNLVNIHLKVVEAKRIGDIERRIEILESGLCKGLVGLDD